MEKLLTNITMYMDYIRTACNLYVSVHFSADILRRLPRAALDRLLPYNSHTNPYCISVKKNRHPDCIAYQQTIMAGSCDESFCRTCHAGVSECIYPICKEEKTIGYVAISGYRDAFPSPLCENESLWESALRNTPVPRHLCDAIIPPLCVLFSRLFDLCTNAPVSEYNMILQFLREYHTGITLADLCRHFGRSKSYISHMFKKESGMSLRKYCNNLKLEDAKKLLVDTTLSVTEIALDTGFNDVSYFISLFREKFSVSPLQYRKENKK